MMLALLLAAAPVTASDMMHNAALRLDADGCTSAPCGPPARSPYRIAPNADTGASDKDRAAGEDGGECSVVGAKLCTSKGMPLLRSEP